MKDHLRQLTRQHAPLQARNVAREYLQSRILGALQRAGAMTSMAFQGGTCLRFVFGLPRYSEDLDFALERGRAEFDLRKHLQTVQSELAAENYRVDLRLRTHRTIQSAMVRFPGVFYDVGLSPNRTEVLAVRVEVDTRPPSGATMDVSLVRRHVTLRLHHHDRSSLLAGKVHALLQRPYAKGRDWFDLIWYLSDPEWPPINLGLLNAALEQTGWAHAPLEPKTWRGAVRQRIDELDWRRLIDDVHPFLEQQHDIDLVSRDNVIRLLG